MKIINYGHACFKVIDDGVSVVFDPYDTGSVPGLELPNNIRANYVFISHNHFDHNAKQKVQVIPTDAKLDMTEVELFHDDCGGAKRGKSIARVIRFSDYSICHLGDAGDVNQILQCEQLKNIDVVLCPINGFFTISAEDAIQLQEKMGWKLVIPMHYFDRNKATGYPDGDQIAIYKKHFQLDELLMMGDYLLEVDEFHMSFKTIVFLVRKEGNNNNG